MMSSLNHCNIKITIRIVWSSFLYYFYIFNCHLCCYCWCFVHMKIYSKRLFIQVCWLLFHFTDKSFFQLFISECVCFYISVSLFFFLIIFQQRKNVFLFSVFPESKWQTHFLIILMRLSFFLFGVFNANDFMRYF